MAFKVEVIKKHPVITGAVVVVAGLVFYVVYSAGSGGASAVQVSGGPSGPSQSDLQAQQIQGQLAALGLQSQTQITLANIGAQNDQAKIAYQYQIAQLQAGLEAAHDLHEYDLAKLQTNAQLEAIQTQYQSSLAQAQINAGTQLQIASINSDLTKFNNAINAQLQQSMIEGNTLIAQYNAQAGIAQAQAYGSAAKAAASASKTQSWSTAVVGLASIFFCDVNIKSIIGCVDSNKCLAVVKTIPLDYWSYIEGSTPHSLGDHSTHVGTYAQSFYCALGAPDWERRRHINSMDMFGVLIGAIKALENKSHE